MIKKLYVFTDNYPFGLGEAFLNSEAVFLPRYFSEVHYVPLWKNGEMRSLPVGSFVEQPLLNFNPKGNVKLVVKGLFCFSPLLFAIPVFFKEKVWTGKKRFWSFMTSLLIIRAAYSSLSIRFDENSLLYSYWGDRSALLFPLLKKKYRVKCLSRFHGTDLYEEACGGYKPFRRSLFKELDIAVPISEYGKRYLMERYGDEAPKRIEVHRLGVFDQGLNFQKESETFRIVSCSNMVPVKRVSLLAEAIGKLGFKVDWVHIGDGPTRSEVEGLIANFPKHISGSLLGALPNTKVLEYYSTHHVDLFINVSESEGVPVSIMEAFSFGIPVIATNVGGVSEIVDGNVGKLLPVDVSATELKDVINAFQNNSNRDLMRIRARERWELRCDAQKNYVEFCLMMSNLA